MARKRMISPSIWESDSFSELTDFAKLVYISLISHADDEGRGKAKPATIANITFPNDDNRRVADIKKALQEIALHMSVQFYSVDGREYYAMTNWLDYQKIDKPTKSKLPPPPIVGVGGTIPNSGNIGDSSGSIRGVIGESSPPNIIKDNRIENNIHTNALTREEEFDLLNYDTLLQIVKEECPTVFNRHQVKVDKGNLQIVRDVMQILEQLQDQYSYAQLREIFRKANKIFCVKPSYSGCDIKWVLNNISLVLSEEESKSTEQPKSKNKGVWDDALDKLGRLD